MSACTVAIAETRTSRCQNVCCMSIVSPVQWSKLVKITEMCFTPY